MADQSTYAVKLDTEVKEELQELLEGYKQETGTNSGDFIKTLLEVYKTNKIVSKVSSADADIKELNLLTNRIYSIYSNLIERHKSNSDNLQLEFAEQLQLKDTTISSLKTKLQEIEAENQALRDAFNNSCADKTKLEQELQQVKELNDSYKLNISKLQEDTKSLHDIKEVNNKLLNEIEATKQLLADSQSRNIELNNNIKDKDSTITGLSKDIEKLKLEHEKTINDLNNKYAAELEAIKGKAEFEKDKTVLELEKTHQQDQQELQNKHNAEIEQYQSKYRQLLEQLEKSKTKPPTKTTK